MFLSRSLGTHTRTELVHDGIEVAAPNDGFLRVQLMDVPPKVLKEAELERQVLACCPGVAYVRRDDVDLVKLEREHPRCHVVGITIGRPVWQASSYASRPEFREDRDVFAGEDDGLRETVGQLATDEPWIIIRYAP